MSDTPNGRRTLDQHAGRTLTGVHVRIAARLLALATAIRHCGNTDWKTDAPAERSLVADDVGRRMDSLI